MEKGNTESKSPGKQRELRKSQIESRRLNREQSKSKLEKSAKMLSPIQKIDKFPTFKSP